jgi:hypothetical protein
VTPRHPAGMLVAVMMVRDEVDILPLCVANLLGQGVDVVLVADHGSTDGTAEWLERTADLDPRVQWVRSTETGFYQSDVTTTLARVAAAAGATWIIPVDADEFWIAAEPGDTLADVLGVLSAETPAIAALQLTMEDFPAPSSLERFTAADLPRFRFRFADSEGQLLVADIPELRAGEHSFLPHTRRTKCLVRAAPHVVIGPGAHTAFGLAAGRVLTSRKVRVLHIPLRDRGELRGKAGHGRRLQIAGAAADHGWQQQMTIRVATDDEWQRLWRANSVGPGGRLPGERDCDRLVDDHTLADLSRLISGRATHPPSTAPPILTEHWLDVARRQRAGQREAADLRERLRQSSATVEQLGDEVAVARTLLSAQTAARQHAEARAGLADAALRSSWSHRLTRARRKVVRPRRPLDDAANRDGSDIAWARDLVDVDWYLATYPDVADSGEDPVRHFALWGSLEGRRPRPTE